MCRADLENFVKCKSKISRQRESDTSNDKGSLVKMVWRKSKWILNLAKAKDEEIRVVES